MLHIVDLRFTLCCKILNLHNVSYSNEKVVKGRALQLLVIHPGHCAAVVDLRFTLCCKILNLHNVSYGNEEVVKGRALQLLVIHPGHCAAVMDLGLLLHHNFHYLRFLFVVLLLPLY